MADEDKVELATLHEEQRQAVRAFGIAPLGLAGQGIVISLYDKEFASGWVLLNELARLGVKLPIEAWHHEDELAPRFRDLVLGLPLSLTLRILPREIVRWTVKPYAISKSSFREVLWLDSDNFPIRDPGFLFEDEEYRAKGSLFWRDVGGLDRAGTWHPRAPVWAVFAVPYNDCEEFETGQLLVDKARCWSELGLTLHFNQRGALYHRIVYGDKDTFRLAWQNLAYKRTGSIRQINYLEAADQTAFGFMPFGPFHMGHPNGLGKWGGGTVMVQRDRNGIPLFNHRNLNKFTIDQANIFNADILHEAVYHDHIKRLRALLAG